MMRDSEDWLSRTIQTVDAVMQQHGFAQGASPRVERSDKKPIAEKRFRLEALLRALPSTRSNHPRSK